MHGFTQGNVQNDVSIFCVLMELCSGKGMISFFLLAMFGSSRHRRRKLVTYLDSQDSLRRKHVLRNKSIALKYDLI